MKLVVDAFDCNARHDDEKVVRRSLLSNETRWRQACMSRPSHHALNELLHSELEQRSQQLLEQHKEPFGPEWQDAIVETELAFVRESGKAAVEGRGREAHT